jgi:uncharacterized membrane protein
MIAVGRSEDGSRVRLLARGNFSLDAGGLATLLIVLGVLTLGMASLLAWKGYWPVLMVALVQLALITWIFIRVWENTWVLEEIVVDAVSVHVVKQRHRRKTQTVLESAWTTVRMEQPEVSWYAANLILRCKGQQVELGAFLTQDEKQRLARHLSVALADHSVWRK